MAFPTTSVLHAFTGTNGTDLNVYSADYQSAPTGANPMEIQGNAATGSVNTAYNANFLSTSYGPDSENFITVTTLPSTGYPVLLPIRCVNETSMSTLDGYCLYYVDTSLSVQRIDNGVLTQLGSAATQTISAGDSVGIECQSSSHRMYYKASGGSWGQVGSTQTDSTYTAAGKIGLYSYGTTVRLDDHGGGTLSATQTLTPPLVTNTQTFYAPTVGRGAVSLSPSLVTNNQTFFAPAVASTYALTPSLVTNAQIFYGPVVAAGVVTLQPNLITNAQTFFAPIVAAGVANLAPGLLTNEQTFFGPTVSASVTLAPALVTNSQSFFAPTVTPGAVTLAPSLVVNGQTFYTSTVSTGAGLQELQPSLVTNAQTFYGAVATASYTLSPELFTNEQIFPAASVSAQNTLAPALVTNTSIFYSATVSAGAVDLQPSLVTNEQTFYPPTVLQQSNVELLPGLLTNEQVFFSPTVALSQQAQTQFGGWFTSTPTPTRTRKDRDEERQRLGILPAVEVPVTPAEARELTHEDRQRAHRAARKLLERFAPEPTVPVAAVTLPAPEEQPTIGPVELPMEVQATLIAAQKKRAFEQDLVYIVATLIS